MIKICGIQLSQLPSRNDLSHFIHPDFFREWRLHHRNVRDERAARMSLGGLALLNLCGVAGELAYEEDGRPYLKNRDLDFNITHTEQHIFCALETREVGVSSVPSDPGFCAYPAVSVPQEEQKRLFEGALRVGIDAENLTRIQNIRICPMASRWFTEREYAFFQSDSTDLTFLRIWTRKEALVKWTGEGLKGLRAADTTLAESMYGIRFYEYFFDRTLVTLCCHATATPPSDLQMISNSALLERGFPIT